MIVIVGGGLAGMSTAYHLGSLDHVVLEAESTPGGLCRSREVDGFVFDYTGHLLHLRDPRIAALVEDLLPDELSVVERRAAIRTGGATLPFPFQANLGGLPKQLVADCIVGFVESLSRPVPEEPGASFEEWSLAVFGRAISEAFMFPYNRKLFCREPSDMTADWVSWAVPRPSLREVVQGALGIENKGMGYNPTFRYPRRGGIGVLPAALARRVARLRVGARVVAVDSPRKRVRLADGEELAYERLVVTNPLPQFLRILGDADEDLRALGQALDWTVVGCLNLGVDRAEIAGGAHWIYFPDVEIPFYRVGFPSNFSAAVSPPGTSSMYVEFAFRRGETPDLGRLEAEALEALEREGILQPGDRTMVRDWVCIDPGYVIFDRARRKVLERLLPELESRGIHTIGRYGAWTYSYMERSLLDGLELAHHLADAAGGPG